MFARLGFGVVLAASVAFPAMAGQMSADEAKRFVAGKVFAFTCFDGTKGAGRIYEDGGAAGAIQFSGAGPTRNLRLPVNTLQVRGGSVCASIKGLPFEPCFNLDKNDERSFRGSVSGMRFAYCDFRHQGASQMLMARAHNRTRGPRSLMPEGTRQADATPSEAPSRVETPRVEAAKIEPVKPAASKPDAAPADGSLDLRKSTN
jgi:hypothetical protein